MTEITIYDAARWLAERGFTLGYVRTDVVNGMAVAIYAVRNPDGQTEMMTTQQIIEFVSLQQLALQNRA